MMLNCGQSLKQKDLKRRLLYSRRFKSTDESTAVLNESVSEYYSTCLLCNFVFTSLCRWANSLKVQCHDLLKCFVAPLSFDLQGASLYDVLDLNLQRMSCSIVVTYGVKN